MYTTTIRQGEAIQIGPDTWVEVLAFPTGKQVRLQVRCNPQLLIQKVKGGKQRETTQPESQELHRT